MNYVKAGFGTALGVIAAFAVVILAVGAISAASPPDESSQPQSQRDMSSDFGNVEFAAIL